MLEIGHNIRWVADDCEWTITANDPSMKRRFLLNFMKIKKKQNKTNTIDMVSGQHVSLSISHIDNEPVFDKYVARLTNQTSKDCYRKIYVWDFLYFFAFYFFFYIQLH